MTDFFQSDQKVVQTTIDGGFVQLIQHTDGWTIAILWAEVPGGGRRALEALCREADRKGIVLDLSAYPQAGGKAGVKMTKTELKRWYEQFGFRGTCREMVRQPKRMMSEGLIPVPPKMLRQVMRYYRKQILWWARDQLRGKTAEYPELVREFKILVAEYVPEGLPKERYKSIKSDPLRAVKFKLDMSDMPAQYEKFTPVTDSYLAVLDWEPRKRSGGWHSRKHFLVVNPMSQDYMQRYPQRGSQDTLSFYFSSLEGTVEHELRHAVQTLLLEPSAPEQVKMHHGYDATDPSSAESMIPYFKSPIEFDPTIGSSALSFVRDVEMMKLYGKKVDLGKAIRQVTGMVPTKFYDTFRGDPFFMVLRKRAPERYKLAVRKFIGEVDRLMSEDQRDLGLGDTPRRKAIGESDCRTPGANYAIRISDHELEAIVTLPDELTFDFTDDEGEEFDDRIHDALEATIADMLDETDPEAEEHWDEARKNDPITEAPIELHQMDYSGKTAADPSSFHPDERGILDSPKAVEKIKRIWRSSVADVIAYFLDVGLTPDRAVEVALYGPGSPLTKWKKDQDQKEDDVWELRNLHIQPTPGSITVIFTNNEGSDRVPITGWILAHRLLHVLVNWGGAHPYMGSTDQRETIRSVDTELNREIMASFSDIGNQYHKTGGVVPRTSAMPNVDYFLACALGSSRACRTLNLSRGSEVVAEWFAEFMLRGKVTLNRLKARMPAFGLALDVAATPQEEEVLRQVNAAVAQLERSLNREFARLIEAAKGGVFAL